MNKYGLLPALSAGSSAESLTPKHVPMLRELLIQIVPDNELKHVLIMLNCLAVLASDDGKPLFTW